MAPPKLTLYTSHLCPWAHRAHIALAELGIAYDEVIIDLTVPREPWYLKINPRGVVPSLKVEEADGSAPTIVTESSVIANYLADRFPSHLVPVSDRPGAALARAHIAFFADTFNSKVTGPLVRIAFAESKSEAEAEAVTAVVEGVVSDIEPLLAGTPSESVTARAAAPYFDGNARPTLAEVLTASFIIRLLSALEAGADDVYPSSLGTELAAKAPKFWAWAKTVSATPSVTDIFDAKAVLETTRGRVAKMRAKA